MKAKRIISLLASLAMMVTAVTGAMTASASEVANGTCGDGITWTLDSDGKLTISGEGEMISPSEVPKSIHDTHTVDITNDEVILKSYMNDYISTYTYKKYSENIKEVVIDEGVTSIGFCAFYKLPNLETVSIPSSISSYKGIGFIAAGNINSGGDADDSTASFAFADCPTLKNITLADDMTVIGAYLFYGCTSLESVEIPKSIKDWEPSSFAECSKLKDIKLPEGLTVIGGLAFCGSAVENVIIPSTIEKWLLYHIVVKKTLENFNGAFYNCKNLTSVILRDGIKEIKDSPFVNCPKLTRAWIPKSVTDMQSAFENCTGLEEVYIEEGVQIPIRGNRDSYFDYSFNYCVNLKKVEMFEGVNTISNNPWCEGCTSLTDVYVHGMNSSISRISDSVTVHCDYGSKIYNSTSIKNKKIEIEEDIENALKELNTAVTEAEKYAEEDYTTDSYGALKTALENAKKYDENSTGVLPIEWAADDIMTAIAGLRDKSEEPSSDPSSSDPSDSSNPTDDSSDPSNSSDNNNQSQSPNTPATPPTSAPTTATPKPTTPPAVTTTVTKPAKVKNVKVTAKKKKLNVSWKKVSGATGYEVLSATNNKFTKNKKTVTVKKNKVTLKRLKSKKKYFVKVRAYKLANGRKYFGKWSKVVKKKVK